MKLFGSVEDVKKVMAEEKEKRATTVQEIHEDRKEKVIKYDNDLLKVVEVPIVFTKDSWDQIHQYLQQGYTIKAILEREFWKTSQVILEKTR